MSHRNMGVSQTAGFPTKIKPPVVSSVLPVSGAAAGGTPIVITGTGFKKSANPGVTVGGVACTGVTVTSATTIACVTGAHAAAAGLNIVVTNDNSGDGYSLGSGTTGNGLYEYT